MRPTQILSLRVRFSTCMAAKGIGPHTQGATVTSLNYLVPTVDYPSFEIFDLPNRRW